MEWKIMYDKVEVMHEYKQKPHEISTLLYSIIIDFSHTIFTLRKQTKTRNKQEICKLKL